MRLIHQGPPSRSHGPNNNNSRLFIASNYVKSESHLGPVQAPPTFSEIGPLCRETEKKKLGFPYALPLGEKARYKRERLGLVTAHNNSSRGKASKWLLRVKTKKDN